MKTIDLNDWEQFGGGGNGWSYYHKTDKSIMLKLNKESISMETTLSEFNRSKALFEMGVKTPKPIEFVTDGTRYGMIMQRIYGKKSYAKMISEDPSRIDELAKRFAQKSKEFHAIECDTTLFPSIHDFLKNQILGADAIPQDIKDEVIGYIDSFDRTALCIHGDFNPGNIIRAEDGQEYWIDLGDFGYGDPDYDLAALLMLSKITPAKVVKYLFHISREQCAHFLDVYGREYYGNRWDSPELKEKIRRVLMVKSAATIAKTPQSAKLFMPLLKGQKLKMSIVMWLADHLMKKYN